MPTGGLEKTRAPAPTDLGFGASTGPPGEVLLTFGPSCHTHKIRDGTPQYPAALATTAPELFQAQGSFLGLSTTRGCVLLMAPWGAQALLPRHWRWPQGWLGVGSPKGLALPSWLQKQGLCPSALRNHTQGQDSSGPHRTPMQLPRLCPSRLSLEGMALCPRITLPPSPEHPPVLILP